MTEFWKLEPEVAGELGDGSVVDTSVHPPNVTKLAYRFTGWLGDDLLETFPCFIVTDRLAKALSGLGATGYTLDTVDVVISDEFREMYPGRVLPEFHWVRVSGRAGADDLGIDTDHSLVVSSRVLKTMQTYALSDCEIEEFGP